MKLRLREKTTATLLIAIFMISIFTVVVPVSADTLYVGDGGYSTIQAAINAASDGDKILVGSGDWFGAIVDKDIEIRGCEGAVINDGPDHTTLMRDGFRLVAGSSGATISHFTFQGVELAIYGWGTPTVTVDDVTIEHNKIYDTIQGITNWDGDNWIIKHNVIEEIYATNGGGIGICFGSRYTDVSGNVISHNKIVAHIPDDNRTFSVVGIVLCPDGRYFDWDPRLCTDNKIVHNKVKYTGGSKAWAIELSVLGLDTPPSPANITYATGILRNNLVGFNDLRGSDNFIHYHPDELKYVNTISRNLGADKNRGQGETPANIFSPV